ncbi:MAG: Sugar porter (SP) family MFS transporter [Candidatus Tokpelaia sp. JSC189]|nr:MAG: Sugar porter (SP) family MFS transporter [Candidatus Tokpelaia sp. JSC189]
MTKRNDISIEDVPLNRFHQLLSVRSGGGWLIDGYILSIIGVVLMPLSIELELDEFWQGLIAASALFGIFIGGFLGGWLTGLLGRQKVYFIGPIIFILCSLGQFLAETGLSLFIFRFLIGIGVGCEYPAASTLLVEFLPEKHRGPRLAALTILWFAGAALAYIMGNVILSRGGSAAWRLVLASPAFIGVLLVVVRLGTPESPRWLVSKGRLADAERIIKKVYGSNFSLRNLPEQAAEAQGLSTLLRAGYGPRIVFFVMFWMCSVIPVLAVYAFAPKVLQALNLTGYWAAYGSIAITILFVIGCGIATRLINVIGRRPLVIHSFLWSGIALLGLGAFSDGGEWLVLVFFSAYSTFIGGAQVLQLVYPNEIFPTEIRAAAVGIGASLSRIGAAIGTYLVPISLQTIGIRNTMYTAASITILGFLVSLALAPETCNMSLEKAASLKR